MMQTEATFTNAFRRFLAYLTEAEQVVHLYIEGLGAISRSYSLDTSTMFGAFVATHESAAPVREYFTEMDQWAKQARADLTAGTPLLIAHTVVGTWGAFEPAFFDILAEWLIIRPEVRQREDLQKAREKISAADWDRLGEFERIRLWVDKIYAPLRHGRSMIERFITLLDLVGLPGPVDDTTKQTLGEMYAVRNVIVHQASWVDQEFNSACPWLGFSVGDRLTVTQADWLRYQSALLKFSLMVLNRQSSQSTSPTET
jgi:hypothetical protein